MEKNEDFLRRTKISEVFPTLSPGEKVKTLDHFKNSNDMDIHEFNIFQPGDQGLGHSSIINPGSIKNEDNTIDLLFRGEDTDASFSGYLMTDKASSLKCTGTINNNNEIEFSKLKKFDNGMPAACRPEDWRMFRHKDRVYSNFSNYYYLDRGWPQKTVRCSMGLSLILGKRMQFLRECDQSRIGLGESKLEKNWAFFSHNGKLKAVYCCEPWVVIEFDDSGNAISYERTNFKIKRLGNSYMACSTNPIEINIQSLGSVYLMFLHQYFYPNASLQGSRNRTYYQHALIINKDTLKPIAWTPKPILGGGISTPGQFSGVLYTSSCVAHEEYIYAFTGIGDSSSSYFRFKIEDLEKNLYTL